MPDLLWEVNGLTVDRGRQLLRKHLEISRSMLRKIAKLQGTPLPSANPLTLFSGDMKTIAPAMEPHMGRMTPAQLLAACIADMVRVAKIFEGQEVLGIQL